VVWHPATVVLSAIGVYPVKSLAGRWTETATVERWGLRGDRRWLALNPDGSVLTAREERRMLGVTATVGESGTLRLAGRDGSACDVDPPLDGEIAATTLSRLARVRLADLEACDWLSRQIAHPVRLGWLDDPRRRSVSVEHGGRAGDALNLADAGPLLLTTTASLCQLNRWIDEARAKRGEAPSADMVMLRFRPSIVVDGCDTPFVEDGWRRVRVGDVEFRFAEHCDRCVLTTVDPDTLESGKEPLRTLARYRQWDHKTFFGVRLIPASEGSIHVGDSVTAE
jgi:uncharacterized protein YcbX